METTKTIIKRILLSALIIVQLVFFPSAAFADGETTTTPPADSTTTTQTTATTSPEPSSTTTTSDQTPTTTTTTPPAPTSTSSPEPSTTTTSQPTTTTTEPTSSSSTTTSTPGPQEPSGAGSTTYTYNSQTGLWENDYYTWDPVTKQTTPKTQQTYSYNPSTGMWDTTQYQYSPTSGSYVPNTISTAKNPAGSQTNSFTGGTGSPAPGSTVPLSNSTTTGAFDLFYDASISNTINSLAQTGNALVASNTFGGNALSGNAQAIANVINLLQSSWSPLAGTVTTFTQDINGDVIGDLYIDPGVIKNTTVASDANLSINTQTNGLIDNNITLKAVSGDATVQDNLSAGSAQTGTAEAVANVANIINSSISAGNSFFGVLNINGNLDGDILLPDAFLNDLYASNAPRTTLNTAQFGLDANLTNSTNITNNVKTTAASGNALVDQNTYYGAATTGDASTNVTIFNLTGQDIIGANALLVFVNVMGNWVGLITNAPAGTTAAALGGGTQQQTIAANADINSTNSATITNDIDVAALSGDATVQRNTIGGGATSGDTKAGVNLLNIANSQLSFSNWFGVLFINVFGSWKGSFGIDTAAGTRPTSTATALSQQDVKVFRFVPAGSQESSKKKVVPLTNFASLTPTQGPSYAGTTNTIDSSDQGAAVLGASDNNEPPSSNPITTFASSVHRRIFNPFSAVAITSGIGLLLGERLISSRSRRKIA